MMNFIGGIKSLSILLVVLTLHALVLWQIVHYVATKPVIRLSEPSMKGFIIPLSQPSLSTFTQPSVPPKTVAPKSHQVKPTPKRRFQPQRQSHRVKSTPKRRSQPQQKSRQVKKTISRRSQQRSVPRVKPTLSQQQKPQQRHKNQKPHRVHKEITSNTPVTHLKSATHSKPQHSHQESHQKLTPKTTQSGHIVKSTQSIDNNTISLSSRQTGGPAQQPKMRQNHQNPTTQLKPKATQQVTTTAIFLGGKPPYPLLSRRLGEQGQVLLTVKVSAQGQAIVVQVKQSSGSTRLDNAAIKHVKQGHFTPAKQAGKPIVAWKNIRFVFQLH